MSESDLPKEPQDKLPDHQPYADDREGILGRVRGLKKLLGRRGNKPTERGEGHEDEEYGKAVQETLLQELREVTNEGVDPIDLLVGQGHKAADFARGRLAKGYLIPEQVDLLRGAIDEARRLAAEGRARFISEESSYVPNDNITSSSLRWRRYETSQGQQGGTPVETINTTTVQANDAPELAAAPAEDGADGGGEPPKPPTPPANEEPEPNVEPLRARSERAWQQINEALVNGERGRIDRVLSKSQRAVLDRLLDNDANGIDFDDKDRQAIVGLGLRIQVSDNKPDRPRDFIPSDQQIVPTTQAEPEPTEPEPNQPPPDVGGGQPAVEPVRQWRNEKVTVENWQPGTLIDADEGLAYLRSHFEALANDQRERFLRQLDPIMRGHLNSILYTANRGEPLNTAQRRHLTDLLILLRRESVAQAVMTAVDQANQQGQPPEQPEQQGQAQQQTEQPRRVEPRPTDESFGGRLEHRIGELNRTDREEFNERWNDLSPAEQQQLGQILNTHNGIYHARMFNELDDQLKNDVWQVFMAKTDNESKKRKWYKFFRR